MLLIIFALLIGLAIGRARGGQFRSLSELRLNRAGFLAIGITAALVQAVIGPSAPLLWMLAAYGALIFFGLRNLQLTGIIIAMIGMFMNLVTLIANGSVPVSERALRSVGDLNDAGQPVIEGIRESTETATSFGLFADIVPVPVFGVVVSLGDLIILVALADIAMHVMLRASTREPDPGGFSYSEKQADIDTSTSAVTDAPRSDEDNPTTEITLPVQILSPTSPAFKNRPAHALHRRPRLGQLASLHIPAHAKPKGETTPPPPSPDQVPLGDRQESVPVVDPPQTVITKPDFVDDEAVSDPATNDRSPGDAATGDAQPYEPAHATEIQQDAIIVLNDPDSEHGYVEPVETPPAPKKKTTTTIIEPEPQFVNGVDPRPIIDLTNSPTDAQLCEFLRRRSQADLELAQEKAAAAQLSGRHRLPGPRRRGRNPMIDLTNSETRV